MEDRKTITEYVDEQIAGVPSITDKADKSNVLQLNNTTAFTPDADYEPATKKYVDDNGGSMRGVAVFAQATEPTDKEVGDIWIQI